MSVYRIVLAVMILPCLKLWVSGKAGRIRTADVAVLLYCFWCMLSYFVNNGAASIQTSGITFIETAGSYWLARCYIRGADDFYNMVRLLFRIVAFLLPFAIFQCVTGRNILLELFTAVMATPTGGEEPRAMGANPGVFGFRTSNSVRGVDGQHPCAGSPRFGPSGRRLQTQPQSRNHRSDRLHLAVCWRDDCAGHPRISPDLEPVIAGDQVAVENSDWSFGFSLCFRRPGRQSLCARGRHRFFCLRSGVLLVSQDDMGRRFGVGHEPPAVRRRAERLGPSGMDAGSASITIGCRMQ